MAEHDATFYWLIERMPTPPGARPMYWSGSENRIIKRASGISVTFNPLAARRVPHTAEDLAIDIAAALNAAYPLPDGQIWVSVEHGFIS